jgi:ribosomal protein L12E/L44/L45/RPP1/RPP2
VLDAECLLRVFANIPQAQIKREVTLITQHTPDEVLTQLGAERIRIAPSEVTIPLKGETPAAAKKPAAAKQEEEEEEEEEEEDDRPGFFAWLMGLFGRKPQKNQ